jgi:hypothetical protein
VTPRGIAVAAAAAMVFGTCAQSAAAQATRANSSDEWAWRLALYGWFPSFDAEANVPIAGGGSIGFETDPGSYLSHLQFTFMGTLEARKGPWSFVGDAVYVDFGNTRSNITSIGDGRVSLPVPANANADLKGFIGTLEVGYSIVQSPHTRLDVVGGARYLRIKTRVDWQFAAPLPGVPQQGGAETSKDVWDGVVGVRGQTSFAEDWFVSYYADVGAGSSQATWQAFGGLGYRFKWGDVLVGYRHLAYDFKSGQRLSDLTLSGPLAGVAFRF